MTPYEEITSGTAFGPAMYELFLSLAKESARRYPPPEGRARWADEDVRAWLHDYFFEKKGTKVIATKLALLATDDESLRRLARKAIQNAFTDYARATAAGAMRKRLRTLLTKDGRFSDATGIYAGTEAWTLPEFGDDIFVGDWTDLVRSPPLKEIEPISALNTAGPTSQENVDKIVTAVQILLQGAGGAIRAIDLAKAVVMLFELDDPDLYLLRDTDQDEEEQRTQEVPGQRLEMLQSADRIWAGLDTREQAMVAFLDEPTAIQQKVLPTGTNVKETVSDLKAKLKRLLTSDPPEPGALGIVIARSADLAANPS